MVLTDTVIRALKPKQMRYLVTDGRGRCLEVLPSGKLSWLYRYRFGGGPEKVAIGHYPELSLKAARGERDRLSPPWPRMENHLQEKNTLQKPFRQPTPR